MSLMFAALAAAGAVALVADTVRPRSRSVSTDRSPSMSTIRQLQTAKLAADTDVASANRTVDDDKVKLTADINVAQQKTQDQSSRVAERDAALPEGSIFVVDTTGLLKLHGAVEEFPVGNPDADLTPPAPPTPDPQPAVQVAPGGLISNTTVTS